MGSTISSQMGEAMKKNQESMSKMQSRNMILGQERMRKTMMAQQVALARDRFQWMSGVYTFFVTALTARTLHSRKAPPPAAIGGVVLWGTILAWHWDLAYGNKVNRLNREFEQICSDPQYWFVPIDDVPIESKDEKA